jgi:hypothetical protein
MYTPRRPQPSQRPLGRGRGTFRYRRPKYQPSTPLQSPSPVRKKQKTTHSGRTNPEPSISLLKYSTDTDHLTKFLESLKLSNHVSTVHNNSLLNAAYARSTWAKHNSSINSYMEFSSENGYSTPWPITVNSLKNYIEWAIFDKNLSHASVTSYIYSLQTGHTLIGIDTSVFDNPIIKLMLRGAKNTQTAKDKPTRKIITIPILKLIGHEISNLSWSSFSKQVFWAACCSAFFGSTRMGELLAELESKFDPTSTLTWNDVKFDCDKILLHIKNPKVSSNHGDFIDLYMCEGHSYCPFSCLLNLKNMAETLNIFNVHTPVFCFENGKNLTIKKFSSILQKLLFRHMGMAAFEYSGHSFRPALPSYMAMFPELISKEEIKAQGRWKSSAFEIYTRLKRSEKRKLFNKIIKTF